MFNFRFHARFDQEGITSSQHNFSSLREKSRASLKFSRPLLRFLRSAAFAKYTLRKCVYPFHQRSPCTCAPLFLLSSKDHFVPMTRRGSELLFPRFHFRSKARKNPGNAPSGIVFPIGI